MQFIVISTKYIRSQQSHGFWGGKSNCNELF